MYLNKMISVLPLVCMSLTWQLATCQSTQLYSLPDSTCSTVERDIVAAQLVMAGKPSGGCIELQADQDRFVIFFEMPTLECGQKIKFYSKLSQRGTPEMVIDCQSGADKPITGLTTPGRDLRVVFDNPNQSNNYNVTIMITSYKEDPQCEASDRYLCFNGDQAICIDPGLLCDGYVNCPDAEDEGDGCTEKVLEEDEVTEYHTIASGIVAIILVGVIVAGVGCVVAVVYCVRQYQLRDRDGLLQPLSDSLDLQQSQVTEQESFYPSGPQSSHSGGYQSLPQGGYDQSLPQGGYDQPTQSEAPFGYDPAPKGRYESLPRLPPVAEDVSPLPVDGDVEGSTPTPDNANQTLSVGLSRVGYTADTADVKVSL